MKSKGERVTIKCHVTINGELIPENIHFGSLAERKLGYRK